MLLTRQTTIYLVLPVALWALICAVGGNPKKAVSQCLALLAPIALGQLGTWTYNVYRFGNWLEYGYLGVRWDTPILLGLYSQLLSPGKGLLVYAPVLLIGILGLPMFQSQHKSWALLTLALVILWLVPHSLYNDWSGGGGWGPRLLLPIVPLLFFPAGVIFGRWNRHILGRLTLACLIVLSVLVQVLGISANWARHLQRVYNSSSTPTEYFQRVHYNWGDSPLIGQLRSAKEEAVLLQSPASRAELRLLITKSRESNPSAWETEAVSLLSPNVPDYWFVYFYFLGLFPLWKLILLIAGLIGIASWSAWQLAHTLAPTLPISNSAS
jgi:hypothetical protein